MIDLGTIPFRQARWYRAADRTKIDYVVLHTMEFWERSDSAEWCQNFFATSDRVGSTHAAVDNDSIVRCVRDEDVCFGANGVNHNGLHIEHPGFAAQTEEEWADPYSINMLWLSAELTASWCQRYGIPAIYVDAAGLLAGLRGITTHRDAEIAFPYGGHTDPGINFPMASYITNVRAYLRPPIKEHTMFMLQSPGGVTDGVFLLDVSTIRWVANADEVGILNQAGVPSVTVTVERLKMMRAARTSFGPSPTSGPFVGLW